MYLALFLLPWFLMYGISAIHFNHNSIFQTMYKGMPQWSVRLDRPYHLQQTGGDLRKRAEKILNDLGVHRAFQVRREESRIVIRAYDFLSVSRITYYENESRLVMEDGRWGVDKLLAGLHTRHGFDQNSPPNDAWAWIVDVVSCAILIWIATGVFMWWQIRRLRLLGGMTLAAGLLYFITLLLLL